MSRNMRPGARSAATEIKTSGSELSMALTRQLQKDTTCHLSLSHHQTIHPTRSDTCASPLHVRTMATESSINGNYAPHQGYGSLDQSHAGYASATPTSQAAYPHAAAPTTGAPTTQSSASSASDIPKDEVGWYFVEQYYTTLSRSPEKLFVSSTCRRLGQG